jgi:hypothetical protein
LIKQKIDSDLGQTEDLESWEILRLDISKNFKVPDVNKTISKLSSVSYAKKNCINYPTSVMWIGSTYSLKFYNKLTEFRKHDLKRIELAIGAEIASKLAESIINILRFEVTLRKKALVVLFRNDKVTVNNLIGWNMQDNEKVKELLDWAKKNTRFKEMQDLVIYQVFVAKLGKNRGTRLYDFYVKYQTKTGKIQMQKFFSRTTIYTKLKMIEKIIQEYVTQIAEFKRVPNDPILPDPD